MPKEISKAAMDKIREVMLPLTELDEKEFEEAVAAITAMGLGTINHQKGRKFFKGFVRGALADPPDFYLERRPAQTH